MEKSNDMRTVTIHAEMMERLLTCIENKDEIEHIVKHIRKFNPEYAKVSTELNLGERKKKLKAYEESRRLAKRTYQKVGQFAFLNKAIKVKILGRNLNHPTLVVVEVDDPEHITEKMFYDPKIDRSVLKAVRDVRLVSPTILHDSKKHKPLKPSEIDDFSIHTHPSKIPRPHFHGNFDLRDGSIVPPELPDL